MDELAERGRREDIEQPLERLGQAAEQIGRASSRSWIGYYAAVYYKDLKPPPTGDHFRQDLGPTGNWTEFDPAYVSAAISERAGNPDMKHAQQFYAEANREIPEQKSKVLSVLTVELSDSNDDFLARLKNKVDSISVVTWHDEMERRRPKGDVISSDRLAMSQGQGVPPHITVLCGVRAIQNTLGTVTNLAELTKQAAEHILRLRRRQQPGREASGTIGTKVFIGHGSSLVWRELKDFLENTLRLQVDEFNSVPTAGRATKERLLEMMNEAAFAFLVMTGDDEFTVVNGEDGLPDARRYPRLNVVHEAGLFQGRLGFERAIVLLEDGCEEFSNIEGVTQIRFPRNNIIAKSEEIRGVLRREGLLSAMDSGDHKRLAQNVKPVIR